MIPVTPAGAPVANGGPTTASTSGSAKPDATVVGQSKSSAGVASPANAKAETKVAVDPSRQTTVAPRLRDQETTERSERNPPPKDGPTGPLPSFEETPLQRAARVIFDPPEAFLEVTEEFSAGSNANEVAGAEASKELEQVSSSMRKSPPNDGDSAQVVVARQAESAFEQARKLEQAETGDVDLAV